MYTLSPLPAAYKNKNPNFGFPPPSLSSAILPLNPKIWALAVRLSISHFMATSRDESNPYGALGAGGKFRKKPYRRPPSTPYDRPPTAIRNPTIVPGAVGNSWLRKLVDPARKLLATTAQRFYTSVFRKRLTQPSPSPSPPPQALGLSLGLYFLRYPSLWFL